MSETLKTRTPHRSGLLPSLATLPNQANPIWLTGAIAFMEGSAFDWTRQSLIHWLTEFLVAPGLMALPPIIREPDAASVALDLRADCGGSMPELLTRARRRVRSALQGIIAPSVDDRFLNAALFSGRVQRVEVNHRPTWVPAPRETHCLSDVVLSLFASSILSDRSFFEMHLCVCRDCDRVFFRTAREREDLCDEHAPSLKDALEASSGVRATQRR